MGALFYAVIQSVEIGDPAKALCRYPGMHIGQIPNDANLFLVPIVAHVVVIVVPIKVNIIEEQAFHLLVRQQLAAPVLYHWKEAFVHHFIGLYIKEPVPRAGLHGYVGLMGIFHAARVFLEVPDRVDDADLV